jgi:hypothetical protein
VLRQRNHILTKVRDKSHRLSFSQTSKFKAYVLELETMKGNDRIVVRFHIDGATYFEKSLDVQI